MEKTAGVSHHAALAGLSVFQFDFFELFSAKHFADLRLAKDLNVCARLAPVAKDSPTFYLAMFFPRTTSSTLAAPSERYIAACPAELPLPTTTTVSIATKLAFHGRRGVVNAHVLKLLAPLGVEPAVIRTGRGN